MALDKEFAVGEILSAADVNSYLLGVWTPLNKSIISSGSPVSSVSFSSLSSTFRVFRLTIASSDDVWVRLNNSSSGYENQDVSADSTSLTAFRQEASSAIFPTTDGAPVIYELTIAKLAASTVALATGHGGTYFDSSPRYRATSSSWNNTTNLINRIDVLAQSGTFYGVVSLEGMRSI